MTLKRIIVMFENWDCVDVFAPNEKVAEVLARADYFRKTGKLLRVLSFKRQQ